MKYNAPYGSADPNAPYIDRNTPGAQSGSRVPAAAVEHPQREIMAVIDAAGIPPSSGDLTQLLQAIEALISAATGGGDTSNFVLMAAARARLPIFPEVLTSDGGIGVISPSTGQVRVPAGTNFLHRGIFNVTTVQSDFATAANKTYHVRWTPVAGFALKDLADVGYNPAALAEANVAFDSVYDDMLVARIVTNPSNVATITNLKNKARLVQSGEELQGFTSYEDELAPSALAAPDGAVVNINFARKPIASLTGFTDVTVQQGNDTATKEVNIVVQSLSRYQIKAIYQRSADPGGGYVGWVANA
ncbi:hypothetical protein ATY81_12560 [Rhizobium sp. R72]|uniref:hypothetical protein n=1 Tax=unclassified Rhizobium TaxID=2613769 RepID=UPI000B530C99|nr:MULTISPECIES: hypothetical protein [unclassified Rhizobium]OWV94276.1 hypothetical protein ATY81_12560 [Rhizobium sp. R72]OWV94546.1 hypothetical protein ATY80_12560 [Rhizobium sp. R711]